MDWGGPEFVVAIVAISMGGWVVNNWIRAKHGYDLEDEWGGKTVKKDDSAETKRLKAENRELHELTNVQTVLQLSPILAEIVEQGIEEGVFAVETPLETIQFLFTGAQFLTDGDMFGFTEAELRARRLVTQTIIEKALGAKSGSFDFMNPIRAVE